MVLNRAFRSRRNRPRGRETGMGGNWSGSEVGKRMLVAEEGGSHSGEMEREANKRRG